MRILWIVPYLPWPTTSGGKTRQYHLLRTLSERGHRITLLVQSKTLADDAVHAALEPLLERLIVVPRRPLKHPLTLLGGVFAPWPLLTTVNGLSAPLQTRFTQLLNEHWDVIQVEHSYSLQPFLRTLQQRQREFVLTEHNLESSLGGATYDRFPKWAGPFVQYDQWRCRQWERKAFDGAAHVIAVTEADAQAMRPLSSTPVSVVVNGVDSRAFAEVSADAQSQRLLFVGNYEYAPNLDAVQWLAEEIFPRVWLQCPNARLAVAGYGLPEHWRTRWPDERIEWLGFVPDLCALQRRCAGFVAALRHGGGSKLKVLEAMAAGLPLVSTAQGVSGLAVQPQAHYLAGESTEALADAIVRLLDEPSLARQLADAARDYARQYHDWAVAGNELEHIYRTLLTAKEPQPCA
ncbi:glycosyltransferase family 4 protein [Pseudomonas haemolytica]|uniref:Glycosyltransferase family 4 protein n=1 Tax=Pseudomonas haemolytica TaxID=2600065 RepID=A0A5P1DIZ1_9PSED|nr:glycosyltransferase family 4 protein [Pseudomonas haemolytica]MBJ2249241.1 glycosyltransferase family 4 protein [Pseudomonas haemolytica]MBJ2276377.1 glycosyltransferase family 4 protein [Pseudomonas haemolytica]MBK3451706.1 glycosyltransferase family 4 protein [Pseudomonas haemolytica]MBK3460305.1 glycosyltransferase family 4 protein [Pseudomonas haemolytica]MRJ40463.1 glycosyltransferase family 4 protein [Pseudomonas haemolytica]